MWQTPSSVPVLLLAVLLWSSMAVAQSIDARLSNSVGAPPHEATTGAGATSVNGSSQAGRLTWGSLHLDHIWPLTEQERTQWRVVCDATRVQLLCADCHRLKTKREQDA